MSSTMLRRFAVALAATGAIVAGSASDAHAGRTVIVTRVVQPVPVYVYRPYAPRVVYYSAPVVHYRVRAPRHYHYYRY